MDERYLKQIARERLKGHWGFSAGVAAIAVLLGGLIVGSSFLPEIENTVDLFRSSRFFQQLGEYLPGEYRIFERGNFSVNITNSSLLSLASFILGGVLQLGYAKFLLKQHDGLDYEFNDLFSEFDRFGTGFAQAFLRGLYTTLWSLLFIIPGIIAGYKYAMTPFILAENSELTASEAITLSKQMMDGHKGELFMLDLSFIGWIVLCALTMNIGNLFLNPYRNAAYAAFYRELRQQWQQQTAEEY